MCSIGSEILTGLQTSQVANLTDLFPQAYLTKTLQPVETGMEATVFYGNDYWRVDKALVLQTRTVTTLNNLGHFLPGSHLYLFGCNKIIDLMCGHP